MFLIICFAHNFLLLLGVWSHALEASDCQTQYEREGGTTVLPPGPFNEDLDSALWKYNENRLVSAWKEFTGHQFSGRVTMDETNYGLTIKDLKTTDSGYFTFVSTRKSGQRPTFCIRLVVQEVLKEPPTLSVLNIPKTLKKSCVLLMACYAKFDKDVRYKWTVNNMNYNGTFLQYELNPPERDVTFTCTVFNKVSEKSESRNINCQSFDAHESSSWPNIIVAMGSVIIFLILLSLIAVCCYKKYRNTQSNASQNVTDNQQQVYSSLLHGDSNVYEYMRNSENNGNDAGEVSNYMNVPVQMS
ncbi:hypothetical protein WMY93_014654 [Mugilogobius chulae]|uniref:Ig-like domain-containing protein n=1 Tax=Mugilogobius chulae TaxID=88201 RepID=A0AAW0P1R3_9GOBI